ncbi:proline dehydrogenase family protein [cf. Phormidesmis sp. LEGE 11477]|uniref:proline dehydrogenase family protein n=1 Tax=cf. Phormidesmis sp. LEGE 11477 TaxID=1828680 RepID=UPI00187FBA9D|nr:proline dehydrogenase family protein [cf. Phormidesmis sp. LEGE 11477]MBE9062216.1 proline dehydrogenase family protein [cf. Phormidesmis sp. LEGE 11477]
MSVEFEAAEALRHLALDESIKAYVLQHPPLYQAGLQAAMRFIGGETLDECVQTGAATNQQGHAVTIDFMGESTRDEVTAAQATQEFLNVIRAITHKGLDASISLDLSHIGLVIDPELAYKNALILARTAHEAGLEMMISMEGADRTTLILDIHNRLCEQFSNVGITLQAYLYRTSEDLTVVMQRPGKIRLVKGAYEAPSTLVYSRGAALDVAYRQQMELLIESGHACSIATHDSDILDYAHQLIQNQALATRSIEFEMLRGVTLERLDTMHQRGYRTRIYLPYGKEWHLYLCNRLAEHPPNLYQAVTDLVNKAALLPTVA